MTKQFKFSDKLMNWTSGGKFETISSRMGKELTTKLPNKFVVILCALLDQIELDHCRKAYEKLLAEKANKAKDRNESEESEETESK